MNSSFFPVGATYAPLAKATEVDIGEWEADIANMAKLGLTTFRLFVAWDRVEQVEGRRDFSRVDHAFELARRHGLKVIVNTGGTFTCLQGIYPPRWLHTAHGCALRKSDPGDPGTLTGTRLALSYDDPVYIARAEEFIREVIRRYRDHECLLAWALWNEPRVDEDFSAPALAAFRVWLREKYTTLDALAQAWGTEFPIRHASWDEVFPPKAAGFEHGGYVPRLDWRNFTRENLVAKFELIRRWVKEEDAAHPVLSHLPHPVQGDLFGSEDLPGVSLYSYFNRQDKREELGDGELLDELSWMASLMHATRREDRLLSDGFWVVETEGGPTMWVHNMMPRHYPGRKMNARDMVFTGLGAKAILRWLYRSRVTDPQAGEFNLVGWDGSLTERAQDFGNLAAFLSGHARLFNEALRPGAAVGILCNHLHDEELQKVEEVNSRYGHQPVARLHACLRHAGFVTEILNDRQATGGGLGSYRVLFAPFRPHVSASLAAALTEFVANGGTLIAESPFAIKNENAVHWRVTPGAGLHDVFGAQVYDIEKLFEETCGGPRALDYKARMRLRDEACVESRFADGEPACVSSRHGKGRAILYASIVSQPYAWETGATLRAELGRHLAESGVFPDFVVEGGEESRRHELGVFLRRRGEGGYLAVVVNFSARPHAFELRFACRAATRVVGGSDPDAPPRIESGGVRFTAAPFAWAVLELE